MILYGWRSFLKVLCALGQGVCPRCGNQAVWQLVRKRHWFTLFFIPLIPYRTEYFMACPVCRAGKKLTKQEAKAILNQQGAAYAAQFAPAAAQMTSDADAQNSEAEPQ